MALDIYELEFTKNDPARRARLEFLHSINDPSKWLYGSELRDSMLIECEWAIPRYRHLSRKLFCHYAGVNYNPHTISIMDERFIREIIKNIIEYKVIGRVKDYDWTYLDAYFAKTIGSLLDIDIPYDERRLAEGLRSEFRSPFHGLKTDSSN